MDKIVTTNECSKDISLYDGYTQVQTGMFYCKGFPSMDAINEFFTNHEKKFGSLLNSYDPISYDDASSPNAYREALPKFMSATDLIYQPVAGYLIYGNNGIYYKKSDFWRCDVLKFCGLREDFHRTVLIMCGDTTTIPDENCLDKLAGILDSPINTHMMMTFSTKGSTPQDVIKAIIDVDGDFDKYKTTFIFNDIYPEYMNELFLEMDMHPHFTTNNTNAFTLSRYEREGCYKASLYNKRSSEYQNITLCSVTKYACGQMIQKL